MIICFGIASAFMVLPPHRIIRADGTIVKVNDQSSVSQELKGLLERLKDWRVLGVFIHTPVHVSAGLSTHAM